MDAPQPPRASHLFTVRLWLEEVEHERTEWRGQLYDVSSGEVRYFRDWPMLITLLLALLPKTKPIQHEE